MVDPRKATAESAPHAEIIGNLWQLGSSIPLRQFAGKGEEGPRVGRLFRFGNNVVRLR